MLSSMDGTFYDACRTENISCVSRSFKRREITKCPAPKQAFLNLREPRTNPQTSTRQHWSQIASFERINRSQLPTFLHQIRELVGSLLNLFEDTILLPLGISNYDRNGMIQAPQLFVRVGEMANELIEGKPSSEFPLRYRAGVEIDVKVYIIRAIDDRSVRANSVEILSAVSTPNLVLAQWSTLKQTYQK